jgi:hypothetical protein
MSVQDCLNLIVDLFGIHGDEAFFIELSNLREKLKTTGLSKYMNDLIPIDKCRPDYRGTILHHVVRLEYESKDSMAYVFAIFCFLGCSFYKDDSDGVSVCHTVYVKGGLSNFLTLMTRHKTEIATQCYLATHK